MASKSCWHIHPNQVVKISTNSIGQINCLKNNNSDDYCLTPNNPDQLWNTTGSAARIINVKNNKNVNWFETRKVHALHWITVTKQRMLQGYVIYVTESNLCPGWSETCQNKTY